jgi:hypothetical protein
MPSGIRENLRAQADSLNRRYQELVKVLPLDDPQIERLQTFSDAIEKMLNSRDWQAG